MIATKGAECEGITTTTTTTVENITTTIFNGTTLSPDDITYISHVVELVQDFGSETADTLKANAGYINSLKCSLKDGVIAASPALSSIRCDDIAVRDLEMTSVGNATGRRLAPSKLKVDYAIALPSDQAASANDIGKSIAANTDAFNTAMQASYKEAEKARTGKEPEVVVEASKEVSVELAASMTTTAATTLAPTTQAPQTEAPTPRPTPAPRPPPPPAAEEEEDNAGMIAGVVIGVFLSIVFLGVLFYLFKKNKKAHSEG